MENSTLQENPTAYINDIAESVINNLNSIKSLNLNIKHEYIQNPFTSPKTFTDANNFAIRLTPHFAFDDHVSKKITIFINVPTGIEDIKHTINDTLYITDDEEEMISKITLYLLINLYKVDIEKELKKSAEYVISCHNDFLSLHETAYNNMDFIQYKFIDDISKPLELNEFNLDFSYANNDDINDLITSYKVVLGVVKNKHNSYVSNNDVAIVNYHSVYFNLLTILNHKEDHITFSWLIETLYESSEDYLKLIDLSNKAVLNNHFREMDNVTKIAPGVYLVRTQADFEKAIKAEFSGTVSNLEFLIKYEVEGYPTSYPSIVSLSIGYKGCDYIDCKFVHVNIMKEAIKDA